MQRFARLGAIGPLGPLALALTAAGLLFVKAPLAAPLPCPLAQEAAAAGSLDEALRAYALCLETAPLDGTQRAEAHLARGALFLQHARIDCALADFDQALWIAPGFAAAYVARGEAYLAKALRPIGDQGDQGCEPRQTPGVAGGGAIRENKAGGVRVGREYFPDRRSAERWLQQQRQIADLQKQLNDLQQELADQDETPAPQGASLLPTSAPLQAPGEVTRGLADFSRALELNPELSAALIGRAKSYCLSGQADAAAADWQSFANQDSSHATQLQTALADAGHLSGAIDGIFGPRSQAALMAFVAARCR